jgi:hypothetical protein
MNKLLNISPHLLLLPVLILYLAFILIFSNPHIVGDEIRYLFLANNLLHGFYVVRGENWELINGPGYPLFLVPFLWMKIPLIFAKLANGVFLYFSAIMIIHLLALYIQRTKATIIGLVVSILFLIYNKHMRLLITESMTIFLITLFIYIFCLKWKQHKQSFWDLLQLSAIVTFLCLTKVIFSYVVVSTIVLLIVLYLYTHKKSYTKGIYLCLLSVILAIPYLYYTYTISHKFFYWGGSNDNLYWMSTPYQNEYGDWVSMDNIHDDIYKNHKTFLDSIIKLPRYKQEEAFYSAAMLNIKEHPAKFLKNWYSNIERLTFGTPKTYFNQKPDYLIFLHSVVITIILASGLIFLAKVKYYPEELIIMTLFFFIYLGGSSLVSAEPRQWYILLPFFALWCSFSINKFVQITFLNGTEPL